MSVSFDGIGASNCILQGDSSHHTVTHLEPVKLDERKEVPVGSLGLGNALAVAYDLYNDTGIASQMASHIYPPQLTSFISLSTMKTSTAHTAQHFTPYMRPIPTDQSYVMCPSQLPLTHPTTWPPTASTLTSCSFASSQHSEAYLTPISVNDDSPKAFSVITDSNKLRFTHPAPLAKHTDYTGNQTPSAAASSVYVQSSPSRSTPVTVVIEGTYPQSSSTFCSSSSAASSCSSASSSSSISSCSGMGVSAAVVSASCMVVPSDITYTHPVSSAICSLSSTSPVLPPIPLPSSTGAKQQLYQSPSKSSVEPNGGNSSNITTDSNTKSSSDSSAFPVDESLYEITEEEMREIDASLTNNPDVMASRQWKYYIETNEWTRATCALMACLFTRDQMANSTVLGRGGSQRARLPSNLVAYVVGTIRKRFNKPAAAVRARMAQKCKDERRFGRLTVTGNGTIYTVDGNHEPGASSPVAAVSSKHNGSRRSRKRPAANNNSNGPRTGTNSARLAKSSRSSSPPQSSSDFASTPGYQPTAYLDDACSSTTDSNQLPSLALTPPASTDTDQDLYLRSTDDCLRLASDTSCSQVQPVSSMAQPSSHSLSMMLMVPDGLDAVHTTTSLPSSTPSVLSSSTCHMPSRSTELAS